MLDLAVIFSLTAVLYFVWRQVVGTRESRLINKIPGPRALPIVGNLFEVIESSHEILPKAMERAKKYGPIIRIWLGSIPIVGVHKAEYVEVILSNNKEINKSFVYDFVDVWLGQGLLTSAGSRWLKHRKMITPTFHFKILDSFIPVFERQSQVMIDKVEALADSGKVFDIYPFVTRCALDIICETAMGINFHAQDSVSNEYIDAIYRVSRLIVQRIQRVYLHPNWIYGLTSSGKEYSRSMKTLHKFTERVIAERKQYWKEEAPERDSEDGVKKRKAFLDLLIGSGTDLTDQDIREEVDTFMFEGHDTTTAGVSWTIFLLGRHMEIQDQVAEEVASLWPEGESLSMQALNDMKLLERVIKESLRLYPSVPFISRTLQEDLQFGEFLVPAKTTVSVSKAILHRDPQVFPEPEKFDPDRFLPENVHNRHPFAYVPFSAGPRNCIGQKFAILEEKAVLASFIRSYKFEAVEKVSEVPVVTELIQRPLNGIRIRLFKRSSQ